MKPTMKRQLERAVLGLLIGVGIGLLLLIIITEIKAETAKTQAWTGVIDVAGPPDFQRYVRLALIKAENAGYGRFIALNIARIQPEPAAYYDLSAHLTPHTDGARGTAYIQGQYAPLTPWLWLALLELAVHQSQINNGEASLGQGPDHTAAWIRHVAAESAGLDGEKPILREWESIPEIGGCP